MVLELGKRMGPPARGDLRRWAACSRRVCRTWERGGGTEGDEGIPADGEAQGSGGASATDVVLDEGKATVSGWKGSCSDLARNLAAAMS
jgi:hypothetical protein